jgi:hydroxymethylpyrimidine/phosphomethylpyrimidine kinase
VAAHRPTARALTIAGSDSGGGAGVQADLKAFAACGVHGMSAITAVTAQNTVGVTAVHVLPPEIILAQVRAVATDIGVDAVKIGMLADAVTVEVVAQALDELPDDTPVVLDPVMVSESGAQLLEPSARRALIDLLFPRATVVTPNLPEALALVRSAGGGDVVSDHESPAANGGSAAAALARSILSLGPTAVVVTGGHRDHPVDVFYDGAQLVELGGELYETGAAHGSGCTHSSVLAAQLALGEEPLAAAGRAKALAARAVRDGLAEIGSGAGPVNVLGTGDVREPDSPVPVG